MLDAGFIEFIVKRFPNNRQYTVFECSGVKVFTYFIKLSKFKIVAPEHSNTKTR